MQMSIDKSRGGTALVLAMRNTELINCNVRKKAKVAVKKIANFIRFLERVCQLDLAA